VTLKLTSELEKKKITVDGFIVQRQASDDSIRVEAVLLVTTIHVCRCKGRPKAAFMANNKYRF
jgi:hypothetical protein